MFINSLKCIFAICFFIVVAISGCSKRDAAIESLKSKNIEVSSNSLCIHSSEGKLVEVELLVDAGVEINARCDTGSSPLAEAAWAGQLDIVKYLIDNKADVNFLTSSKLSALSAAVKHKQEPVALFLLDHGANPDVIDSDGSTPLMEAAWQGSIVLVKALVEKNANVHYARPIDGFDAFKAANGKTEVVEALSYVVTSQPRND